MQTTAKNFVLPLNTAEHVLSYFVLIRMDAVGLFIDNPQLAIDIQRCYYDV